MLDELSENLPNYTITHTLRTPAPISSIALGHSNQLFAGSDDGSLRVYDLTSYKVCKAIRGLPAEISSICCFKYPGSHLRDVWLACGRYAYSFHMDLDKLVLTVEDVVTAIELCSDDDVLNELALNSAKTHLAYSADSGAVGVMAISTKNIIRMKTSHSSICGIVRQVVEKQIVSGGYDNCLIHFNHLQGTVLSSREMPSSSLSDGMSLSPPFIMSAAMTVTGVMAAGTADGRLWLGFGGQKDSLDKHAKKKRSRKWDGLSPDDEHLEKIAEGPIVAMAFPDPTTVVLSTLLGTILQYRIIRQENQDVQLAKIWEGQSGISKVNALIFDERRFIVAGLTENAQGIIEIWDRDSPP